MTDLSEIKKLANYRPTHKVRFVTAASLFDGHDASINIMRRILQSMGAEVIHLGHDRSVEQVVTAALQEDVQGIAISSYQGGHVEFFKYMIDLLRERGGENIRVYGGGGGVIVGPEIKELHDYGVARIFSPEDGQKLGLQGMIGSMVAECDVDLSPLAPKSLDALKDKDQTKRWRALARAITALELGEADAKFRESLHKAADTAKVPTLGITGTGGAGKSSLCDELGAPHPPRSGRQAADRGDLDRSVASQERWRAARRSHPHERDQSVGRRTEGLHALARDARGGQGNFAGAARRNRRVQGRRLRSGDRRNVGHRAGRRRDRAARRHARCM